MNVDERGRFVKQLFAEASELTGEDRARLLQERCGADDELRARVDRLLAADERASGRFLEGDDHPTMSGSIPERIADFRILRRIGEGGMGSVFEAEQDHPRRKVAVKVIRMALGSELLLRRFQREVEILGRLQHPGIAQIFEAGTYQSDSGSTPYFAMEYVAGRPLTDFVREDHLDVRARLSMMAGICDAAHHAHQSGVVHRDLKPANILVEQIDGERRAKILDFGVARAVHADDHPHSMNTQAGQLLGTLSYMSPEQVTGRSQDLDARSDVYTLGVISYELLAGQLPYQVATESLSSAGSVIRELEPPRLGSLSPALRGDVETIVAKAMAKERERRYQSAAELADDIRRHLRDEPIAARPVSRAYQVRKFAKRNRILVGGVAATFIALILGIVATGIALARARSAERAALERSQEAQQSAAQAEAIVNFLQEMLASVDPAKSLGQEVSIRQALDQAAARIDSAALRAEPAVEAKLRTTIGVTYQSLGHLKEADRHLAAALETQRRLHPGEHLEIAESIEALGLLRSVQGRHEDATLLLNESLQIRSRLRGDKDLSTASNMQSLGAALRGQGKLDEAEPYYRQALAIRRELLGENHVDVAQSVNSLALLEQNRGNLNEAEALFRQALLMRRELLGEPHPVVADGLNNLANVLTLVKKYDEAELLLREALAMRRQLLPSPHPGIAQSLHNLGLHLYTKGNFAEAEPLFREALTQWRSTLPEKHVDTGTAAFMLGLTLGKLGLLAESESMFREALSIREANTPVGHWMRYDGMIALAAVLVRQSEFQETETLLLACYEGLRDSSTAPPELKAAVIPRLVLLYEQWGRDDVANEWRARLP